MTKCLYTVLGLSAKSSKKEIKSQFYKLSKLYHPDLSDSDSDWRKSRFNEIIQAYSVLSDDKLRRQYDIDNGHITLRLSRPDPSAYNQYIRPAPFSRPNWDHHHQENNTHEDLMKRWERLDRKSAKKRSHEEEDEVYKSMRQEDYRVFRNRVLVLAAGAFLYIMSSYR